VSAGRRRRAQAFPSRTPTVQPHHVRLGPAFVDKTQSAGINPHRPRPPRRPRLPHVRSVLLGVPERFFGSSGFSVGWILWVFESQPCISPRGPNGSGEGHEGRKTRAQHAGPREILKSRERKTRKPFHLRTYNGEGDGTRTRNHRIDRPRYSDGSVHFGAMRADLGRRSTTRRADFCDQGVTKPGRPNRRRRPGRGPRRRARRGGRGPWPPWRPLCAAVAAERAPHLPHRGRPRGELGRLAAAQHRNGRASGRLTRDRSPGRRGSRRTKHSQHTGQRGPRETP